MHRSFVLALVAVFALLGAAAAQADTISLVGDKDCFGLGGPCPDGTRWRDDLGGVFFTSYRTAGDPVFTDEWDSFDSVSYLRLCRARPRAPTSSRSTGVHRVRQRNSLLRASHETP